MNKQKNSKTKMELLVTGKEAFPVILEEIRNAEKSIYIDMFVWRDDDIGRKIATELLQAADRGVKVDIIKDRNGIFFEYSEEDQSSFFHKDPSLIDIIEINCMKIMYQPQLLGKPFLFKDEELLNRMKTHPNINIKSEEYRKDHSKFFIFDEKIVILGGINVEDKENGADISGRQYIDFMIRITGEEAAAELSKALRNEPGSRDGLFGLNIPGVKDDLGIGKRYLELIDNAKRELSIIMSYIMPVKEIMNALKKALDRGVKVRLLFPEKANYTNDSNRASALELYKYAKKNGRDLEIYMSDDMTHVKAMVSENTISIGSANISSKSMNKQGELNVFVDNDGSDFAKAVKESFEKIFANATPVKNPQQLKYSKLVALMEKIVMS